jgi:hypothetical protein
MTTPAKPAILNWSKKMRKIDNRVQAVLVVAVAAIVGSALATGALGSSKPAPHWRLSVFAHAARHARSADATAPRIPLAGVTDVSVAAVHGGDEILIGHRATPTVLYCFWDRTAAGGSGGCGRVSDLEARGAVSLYEANATDNPHVLAIVPDGVSSVTIKDSDGSSHTVAVASNIAVYEDAAKPASVSFTLPNGAEESTDISHWGTPASPTDSSTSE